MTQTASPSGPVPARLRRDLGVIDAVMLGMGSIVGTGVFVSIGIAADVAGPAVLLAIVVGGLVASLNGLSSAQLAASHPVSGGTYEYGYKYLNPTLGFTAGWMFLCAKSASAATAALGFAGYVLSALGVTSQIWSIALGLAAILVLTVTILGGIRRSSTTNTVIVSITLAALGFFVVAGLPVLLRQGLGEFDPFFLPRSAGVNPLRTVFQASALMFVAYTGYGRIATLGEEVRRPAFTIPRAIILTLVATMVLYATVGFVGIGVAGAQQFALITKATAAPLEIVARSFPIQGAGAILAVGAITAMLGVLLNLLLGLSRVLLAMGRRKDMPIAVARISKRSHTPETAVVVVAILTAILVLIGDIKTTWSFSAFTVLIYYSLTNLAALQLPAAHQRFPRVVSMAGLLSCLFLAFWVEPPIWLAGIVLIAVGLGWKWLVRKL